MIPDHPNWSSITDVAAFPQSSVPEPEPVQAIQATSLGGKELADSSDGLLNRWWVVYQEGSNVYIAGANGTVWATGLPLFQEEKHILQLSLTVDQLARPTVYYRTEDNELKLFWYDPVSAGQVVQLIGTGRDPHIKMDLQHKPNNSNSDMIMVYVSSDSKVIMRIQRERWETAHDTGIGFAGVQVTRIGLDTRNRFQVLYR